MGLVPPHNGRPHNRAPTAMPQLARIVTTSNSPSQLYSQVGRICIVLFVCRRSARPLRRRWGLPTALLAWRKRPCHQRIPRRESGAEAAHSAQIQRVSAARAYDIPRAIQLLPQLASRRSLSASSAFPSPCEAGFEDACLRARRDRENGPDCASGWRWLPLPGLSPGVVPSYETRAAPFALELLMCRPMLGRSPGCSAASRGFATAKTPAPPTTLTLVHKVGPWMQSVDNV